MVQEAIAAGIRQCLELWWSVVVWLEAASARWHWTPPLLLKYNPELTSQSPFNWKTDDITLWLESTEFFFVSFRIRTVVVPSEGKSKKRKKELTDGFEWVEFLLPISSLVVHNQMQNKGSSGNQGWFRFVLKLDVSCCCFDRCWWFSSFYIISSVKETGR